MATVTQMPAANESSAQEANDKIWDRAMAFWPTVAVRYMVEGGDIKAHLHKTRREFVHSMTDEERNALYAVYQQIEGHD